MSSATGKRWLACSNSNSDCASRMTNPAGEENSSARAAESENGGKVERSSRKKSNKKSEKRSEKSAKSPSNKDSGKKPSQKQAAQPGEKGVERGQPGGQSDTRSDNRPEQPMEWPGSGVEEKWQEVNQGQGEQPQNIQRERDNQQSARQEPLTSPAPQAEAGQKAVGQGAAGQKTAHEKRGIRLTTSDPDDLHTFYKRGNWKNWDEMINWLRQRTEGPHTYPEDLVRAMLEDMEILKAHGAKLTGEGEQIFKLSRGKVIE